MSRDSGLGSRMDGGYEPPILAEPAGGPVPEWQPAEDDPAVQTDENPEPE